MSTLYQTMSFAEFNAYIKTDFTPKFLKLHKKLADKILELNEVEEVKFNKYSVDRIILSTLYLRYDKYESSGYDNDDCQLFMEGCANIVNSDTCFEELFANMKKVLRTMIGDTADEIEFSSSNFRNMGDHYKLQFYDTGYEENHVGYPSEMCVDVYKNSPREAIGREKQPAKNNLQI